MQLSSSIQNPWRAWRNRFLNTFKCGDNATHKMEAASHKYLCLFNTAKIFYQVYCPLNGTSHMDAARIA